MLDDYFRIRYKKVPLAVSFQDSNTYITELHNHSEFEILLITCGSACVTINDSSYFVKSGDMLFINPFEVHSVKPYDAAPYSHSCICFDCALISEKRISEDIKNELIHIIHHIINGDRPLLVKLFNNIIECHRQDGEYLAAEITAYISLMFIHLMKCSLTDKNYHKTKNSVFCAKVVQYISKHFKDDITSADIASTLSYNQSYFCRLFRKNFNRQFSDYLNMYRIAASRMLLENGEITIAEAASECGFNTQSYFTQCFKKYIGISPSEYKKSQYSL